MPENPEKESILQCLQEIECQLAWGKSVDWSHYDFEKLSEAIWDKTGVRLSVTTLKRLWGKLNYSSAPTLNTLNTLARYAGYSDWRSFKQHWSERSQQTAFEESFPVEPSAIESDLYERTTTTVNTTERPRQVLKNRARLSVVGYWIGLGFLLTVGILIALNKTVGTNSVDPRDFAFKADKMITKGVPNSVVFHYDARAARTDCVYIVQTWDIRRKTRVAKDRRAHSALYYYPGFFRTKLLVDGQVAKTHDLCINTDGWLGLVEEEPIPFYFRKADYIRKDRVEIDERNLRAYNLSLYPRAPKIRFFNQQEMGDLMSDNFVFETSLKTDYKLGTGACQYVEVLIQCEDDIIIIPLAAKPCVGGLRLVFCGKDISSKEADLSGLGCDLTQWTQLRVETSNKQATIYVNGVKAYGLTFPNVPTGIVGLQYRFDGVGAVKDTWFQHKGKTIRF